MSDPKKTCGAKTKRTGKPCPKAPVPGRTRCKWHGGASLRGPAHPSWKNGGFSTALPQRMIANFEASKSDPELVSNRNLLAVLDSRLLDIVGSVGDDPGRGVWKAVRAAFKVLDAVPHGDKVGLEKAKAELRTLIDAGVEEGQVWHEFLVVAKQRRHTAESEIRRLKTLHAVVSTDRLTAYMHRLMGMLQSELDSAAFVRVHEQIDRMLVGMEEIG